MLGLFEHAPFEEETLTLSPGDVIVAFSDGVSEALNEAGDEYTDERLLASVQRQPRAVAPGAARRRCSPTCAGSADAPRQATT